LITEVATFAAVLELFVDGACHAAYQYLSLSVLCYRLSAGLVLNPLWVVTGE
jgi:hypothetical protein